MLIVFTFKTLFLFSFQFYFLLFEGTYKSSAFTYDILSSRNENPSFLLLIFVVKYSNEYLNFYISSFLWI